MSNPVPENIVDIVKRLDNATVQTVIDTFDRFKQESKDPNRHHTSLDTLDKFITDHPDRADVLELLGSIAQWKKGEIEDAKLHRGQE